MSIDIPIKTTKEAQKLNTASVHGNKKQAAQEETNKTIIDCKLVSWTLLQLSCCWWYIDHSIWTFLSLLLTHIGTYHRQAMVAGWLWHHRRYLWGGHPRQNRFKLGKVVLLILYHLIERFNTIYSKDCNTSLTTYESNLTLCLGELQIFNKSYFRKSFCCLFMSSCLSHNTL